MLAGHTIKILTTLVVCAFALEATAQEHSGRAAITAAFYNVENLFDTIDSPFVYDSDFTPTGRLEWTKERYNKKIEAVARVINHIRADIFALAEIENEQATQDLVRQADIDYGYFHYPSSDKRGIDIAILYRPERFFIDSTQILRIKEHDREIITLFGSIDDQRVIFSACHLPSAFNPSAKRESVARQAGRYFNHLASLDTSAYCIITGDFNFSADNRMMDYIDGKDSNLLNTMRIHESAGTYTFGNKRLVYDYFFVNRKALRKVRSRVFIQDYLVETSIGGPVTIKPTYRKSSYTGGTSDHLPIVLEIEN